MALTRFEETVDVGVDYFTVTGTTPQSKQKVWNFGHRIMDHERQWGNERRLWNWKAYEGFKCGAVQVGTRDDSAIVRVSGSLAREHYKEAYQVCTNCSRIDTQVTVRSSMDTQKWITKEFKRALAWSTTLERKPAVDLHWSNNGTATVYFNKRVSDRFGRIYDKGAETGLDVLQGCVRYEVEWKGEQAMNQIKSLASSREPHKTIARDLHSFFTLRSCVPQFNPEGRETIVCPRRKADRTRQLEWIRASVRPTVQRLIECGELAEVLDCLGLGEVLQAKLARTVQLPAQARKRG